MKGFLGLQITIFVGQREVRVAITSLKTLLRTHVFSAAFD